MQFFRKLLKIRKTESSEEGEQTEEGTFRRLLLGYQLQSGRKVNRSYMVNTEECRELLYNLYREENLKNKTEQFLALDTAYLDNITLIFRKWKRLCDFPGSAGKTEKTDRGSKKGPSGSSSGRSD